MGINTYNAAKNFIIILLGIASFFLYPLFLEGAYYLGVVPIMELFNVELFHLQYCHFLMVAPLYGCIKGYKLIKQEEHTLQNHLALFLTSLINRGTAILTLYIINCIVF
jgi:hypothetical protein